MSTSEQPDVSALLAEGSMPIAVVGIACRFPGDATNPDKLWEMISAGRNAHGEWPKDRLNIDAFYHPNPEHNGTFNTKAGHFMTSDVTGFDAPFFSITAKEAHAMDPQQRIALELAYEGLENAGIRIQDIAGTKMGCYMATFAHDYFRLRLHDVEDIPMYEGTGNGQPMLSARLSWFFDLKGPSFVLDTACSSTLVALHLACQSLRTGESTSAIVGGANIMFMPELPQALSNLHFLSPDGRCKSFDASANGYARGEGAAVVILKPLEAALRDGNVIRAVIRGTGVNQDGRTPGITVPSAQSQEALIRSTYAAAGLSFKDTQYFEAHGTGTPVGDPLECSAIGATFGQERSKEHPRILVGSIKPNIGHLEAVAGLAGLIKSIYCVEKGLVPPVVYYEKPNPRIDLEGWKLKIPTELLPWPTKGIRRVSINSFGYGGTNGHCIIDDAYHYLKQRGLTGAHNTVIDPKEFLRNDKQPKRITMSDEKIDTAVLVTESDRRASTDSGIGYKSAESDSEGEGLVTDLKNGTVGSSLADTTVTTRDIYTGPRLLIWSSHEQKATEGRAAALAEYLESRTSQDNASNLRLLEKLAFTLSNKRSRFQWRSYAVVSNIESAKIALSKPSKPVRAQDSPKLCFVFTGQGAQWFGMGRELREYPVYRESIEAAGEYIKSLGADWDLSAELAKNEETSRVGEAAISQPACTAVQVALVDLMVSWGVKPQVVAGHSSGEIGAAYAKGTITREAAWLIAYHRGCLSTTIKQQGAMIAVGLGFSDANVYIDKVRKEDDDPEPVIGVACVNSPSSVTVSGDTSLIDKLGLVLEEDKVFNRKLAVKVAYHSLHMQAIADEYLESMKGLESMVPEKGPKSESTVRMFSSVTGDIIDSAALSSPQYWVSNLVKPVRFDQALQAALTHNPAASKRRTTTRNSKSFQVDTIVEVGPHAALQGPIKQIVAAVASSSSKSTTVPYVSILTRKVSAAESALSAIGSLTQQGYSPDIVSANNPRSIPVAVLNQTHQLTDIPPVVWNRSIKYWHEAPATRAFRFRQQPRHDLVGVRDEYSSDAEPSWRNYFRVAELPWIEHHQVQSSNLYPFAGMLVMAIEAARQTVDPTREVQGYRLRDIQAGAAMVIPHDGMGGREGKLETRLQLRPWRTGTKSLDHAWQEFTIASRNDEGLWTQNCAGLISIQYAPTASAQAQAFINETQVRVEAHKKFYSRLKADKPPQVPIAEFYGFINKLGVQLGPVFQVLKTIGSGHYESICDLVISDTAALMPENYEHDHIIHPTTLDGVVQMAALAATESGLTVDRAKIPRFIDGVWVSATMFDKKAGAKLIGYSTSKPVGKTEYVGDAVIADESWSEELVKIDGCRTVALESLEEAGRAENVEDRELEAELTKMAARHKWGIDVENTPDHVLAALLENHVLSVADAEPKWISELEHACYIFCKRSVKLVQERGLDQSRSKLSPHHRLLYAYMRDLVDNAAKYSLASQPPKGFQEDWLTLSHEQEDDVVRRASQHAVDGKLLCQVGTNLDSILAGEVEPLQVLRENDLLTKYYREAFGTTRIQSIIGQYVKHLSHKRPLKVLEVGAGTGGTTSVILKTLGNAGQAANRLISYMFTDLSSGFFESAATEFAEWSEFLDFKVLNIEQHPRDQGFSLGEYDLVVASNVLHATTSIGKALRHCRPLLKPGGILLLEEITNITAARVPMIVGCLPGWWMGEDDDRKGGPLISEDRWDLQLREEGFDGIKLRFKDAKREDLYLKSLLISAAAPVPTLPKPPREIFIVRGIAIDTDVQSLIMRIASTIQSQSSDEISFTFISLREVAKTDLKKKAVIVALEAHESFLANVAEPEDFEAIKKLILTAGSILWLTKGGAVDSPTPEANVIVGLARTIRSEVPSVRLTTLDLDPKDTGTHSAAALVSQIFRRQLDDSHTEFEFAIRDGQAQVLRLYTDPDLSRVFDKEKADEKPKATDIPSLLPYGGYPESSSPETTRIPLHLDIKTPGVLDTLRFVDDSDEHKKPLDELEVEIFVKAVPLNFHDVMFAMGNVDTSMKDDDDGMGVECSGFITRVGKGVTELAPGDRVVTCSIGSFRTYVRNHWSAVQKIPDYMSFTEAASFTSVYAAAIYALEDLARIQPGETVLIHAASGGFGQASIVIAQNAGAGAIYATVGSEAKKQILIDNYNIPASHILNSRDHLSFSAGLKRLTNGRGVDIVLNSLAGEALRESWLSLAPFGRFIELGKNDMFKNAGLDMIPFLRNTTFTGLNMGAIFNHNMPLSARLLRQVMALHTQGFIQPIRPVSELPFSRIEEAFRTMAAGKHIGKIVLIPSDGDQVPMIPPPALISARHKSLEKASSSLTLRPDATYLIPGGLGGLGRVLARWMASKGARHLVFTSRSGAISPEARALLEDLTSQAVRTKYFALDIGSQASFAKLLDSLSKLEFPPIKGVITFAMQIRDTFFENMSLEDFRASLAPKINITWNMDQLLPGSDQLDFFISMSSIAGVVGSRGQGNYNAGNTYQDALARRRRARGHKGYSICLGLIQDIGFAAAQGVIEQHRYLDKGAAIFMTSDDVIKAIETAISLSAHENEADEYAGVDGAEIIVGLATGGLLKAQGHEDPYWLHESRFAAARIYDTQLLSGKSLKGKSKSGSAGNSGEEIRAALAAAKTSDEAAAVALTALSPKLARAMMMDEADLDPELPANSYGIDSLVAVEIRAWVFKELRSEVSVFEILSNASLSSLAAMVAQRSTIVKVRAEE